MDINLNIKLDEKTTKLLSGVVGILMNGVKSTGDIENDLPFNDFKQNQKGRDKTPPGTQGSIEETKRNDKNFTVEDVRAALKDLKNKKDATAAKDTLKSLGFDKVSDIPETDYDKVIKAIKEAA